MNTVTVDDTSIISGVWKAAGAGMAAMTSTGGSMDVKFQPA